MDRRNLLGLRKATAQEPGSPQGSRAARAGLLPNIELTAHTGERVRFYDDLIRERTVLFNFFLIGCTDGICPTAAFTLREVQRKLGERMGRDIFFYSITLRPQEDTLPVLREYASLFDPQPGWLFLTGAPADIEQLRRAQGFVDRDPERDRNQNNHVAMARYGNDKLERWGMVSVRSSVENIASIFTWLTA